MKTVVIAIGWLVAPGLIIGWVAFRFSFAAQQWVMEDLKHVEEPV